LFLVAPLIISEEDAGLVWFCFHDGCMPSPSLIMHAEQIANQVAVALAKARLVFELEQFNRGTLTALARAIDMKSRWTAGHSERVMKIAHKIGTAMHLSQGELDDLYRGGLIHDIGKIGIPTAILDKPGKLTQEEYLRVCEHPRMGARILEPIRAYAGIVTLVVQHHERYDGSGYPDGLKGEQIALSARILAVADVFEALSADRPYRPGMGFQQIIDYMRQQSGKQFDPAVVAAVLKTRERLNSRDALLLDEHQEAALLHQEHSQGGP